MAIVRLGRFRRLATFSVVTGVSLWAVDHYSDANSVWSSFSGVRFGRAAIAVSFLSVEYTTIIITTVLHVLCTCLRSL